MFNDRVTEIFRPMKYVSPRSPYVSLALPAQAGTSAVSGKIVVNVLAVVSGSPFYLLTATIG